MDKKERKKRTQITNELEKKVIDDYNNGVDKKEIETKYYLSSSSVKRILARARNSNKIGKLTNPTDHLSLLNSIYDENKLTEIKCENDNLFLEVGLIKNRHPIPVSDYIFEKIDNNNLDKFDWQEYMIEKFIDDHIEFDENGIPNMGLQVFVTGLQCVLGALIKVCRKKKVNLTLRHYNPDKGKYVPQIIINEFRTTGTNVPTSLWGHVISNDRLYTYDLDINNIESFHNFFGVSIIQRDTNNKIIDKHTIFTSTYKDMYIIYLEKLFEIEENLKKVDIYLNRYEKRNSIWTSDRTFYKTTSNGGAGPITVVNN